MSARDAILAAAAVPQKPGKLLGQKVVYRGLTAGEQTRIFDGRPIRELLVPVCAVGILGEDGTPLFTEADLEKVRAKPFADAFAKILSLTGFGEEEAAEKNS